MRNMPSRTPLLRVADLKTVFRSRTYLVRAVDFISFDIYPAEIVGLVGESACGKSVTARSIMRLIDFPGKIMNGQIYFNNVDVLTLNNEEMEKIRGNDIAMVFQDPTISLNPTKSIGWQMEHILKHNLKKRNGQFRVRSETRTYIRSNVEELLRQVGIRSPKEVLNYYPHQLSGGMTQRVLIAIILGCMPKLVIADEPTTNLDVTIEAQILKLFISLQERTKNSILYISHDLGVVSELCDRVMVMYAGKIVETFTIENFISKAVHPYTKGLILSKVSLRADYERPIQIKGEVPDLANLPKGCNFYPRCEIAKDICRETEPTLRKIGDDHFVACHLVG